MPSEDTPSMERDLRRPKILVYGPVQPIGVGCGISSAIRAFAGSRVRNHYDIEIVSTFRPHRHRTLLERLIYGVGLLVRSMIHVLRSDAVMVDIHSASDRSLLSHSAILFAARFVNCPAVLRIHGGNFHRVFERAGAVHRRMIKRILRSATCVVVLSEGWRGRIAAIEPNARIEVIPNPVDCTSFERLSHRPLRPCRRILFLANFCEMKGHFDALDAVKKLASEFPDLALALAGEDRDPGTRVALERRADELGIRCQIEFLGTVTGEAKEQAFRDADILILPSHTENMPISIIEGMAAGLPVVATRVGAIGEMIDDGETGLLIDPRDPDALAERLAWLFLDTTNARRLGDNAKRHALSTWDADIVAESSRQLYERLSKGRRRNAQPPDS